MLAVNLGTRGPDAAARLVEYCNHPGGTYWSDRRVKNGAAEPHDVRVWCLGNEVDGDWQVGHKTAEEYGRVAAETAKAMRLVDPAIELVACGSSNPRMPSFGDWEATVLGRCEAVISTADHVRAKGRHAKRINLSFDEWNVWHTQGQQAEGDWERAPRLIEDQYSLTDAVVVGNLLISLLRHADRVRMACLAQLVNAIGAIRSEPGGLAWRQTIFHPFALTSRHGRGTVLRTPVAAPDYDTPAFGMVPKADAVAVLSDSGDELTMFAVNRDQREPLPVAIDVRSLPALRVAHHTYVGGDEPSAANTHGAPDRIVPRAGAEIPVDGGVLRMVLPPLSWNMARIGGEDQ